MSKSEHNFGEKADQSSARELESQRMAQLEVAYAELGIGGHLDALGDLQAVPYASELEDSTDASYNLDVGSDFCVISLPHPTEGRLAVKIPGQLADETPEAQANILQWRATALARCYDHPSFEQAVAISLAEQVIVTRQVEGKNLANFTAEDIAMIPFGQLDELATVLQYADDRDIFVDCCSASNFVQTAERLVCVDYSLQADDPYRPNALDRIETFSRVFDPPLRTQRVSPARVDFGEKLLEVVVERFPAAHDLHARMRADQAVRVWRME